MRLAVEAAGLTPDDAERLRKAIGSQRHRHRLDGLMTKLKNGLISTEFLKMPSDASFVRLNRFQPMVFRESQHIICPFGLCLVLAEVLLSS